jgi:hypothetical protein
MEVITEPASPPDDERADQVSPADAPSGGVRARVLVAAAVGPLVTGYAVVTAVLALVTVVAVHARFTTSGVLLAAGPAWLAAHQVPIAVGGHPLGMLPMVPTVGAVLLVARTAAGAAQRLACRVPGQAVPIVGVITAAHAVFGLVVALCANGSANAFTAFVVPGLFAALSATAGLAVPAGLVRRLRALLDPLAVHGLRAGALGMAALLACGSLVFLVSLLLSVSTAHGLYATAAPGFGDGLGMTLLSLAYLPNAAVAGLSFATGPGFSIGSVQVSMFTFSGGPVPGVPLLAGIPDHRAPWWPVLMVLPMAAGALVGWSVRRIDLDPAVRVRAVGVAGALVGFGSVVLGTLAGGRLGDGPFDPVSVPVGIASIVTFCWILIPGGLVAWLAGPNSAPQPIVLDAEADGEDGAPTEEFEAVVDDESGDAEAPEDVDETGKPAGTDESEAEAPETEAPEAVDIDSEDSGREDSEDPEGAEDTEDTEDTGDSQEVEGAEDSQEVEGAGDSQDVEEAADSQDSEDAEPAAVSESTEEPEAGGQAGTDR